MLTDKNKQVLIIGLILAGVLLFLGGYIYFINVGPALEAGNAERAKLKAQIDKDRAELKRIDEFIQDTGERERMMRKVETAKKRLPESYQAIEFLQLLRESLTRTGVVQTLVAQEKPAKRSLYSEIPYSVRGSARYHEFGQFINLIECNPARFMRVNGFKLTNNPARPSIHPMEVGISTFIFRGQ